MQESALVDRQQLIWNSVEQDIAEAFSCPVSEIEKMLCTEMHQLEQEAHIKDFVPLLVIKQVKDLLRAHQYPPLNTTF